MSRAVRLLKQVIENASIIDHPGWEAEACEVIAEYERETMVERLLTERRAVATPNMRQEFDVRSERKIIAALNGEAVDEYRRHAHRADENEAYDEYVKRADAAEAAGETVATLHIGLRSATCSACGGNASPDEERHISGGPRPDGAAGSGLDSANGCGALFLDRTHT